MTDRDDVTADAGSVRSRLDAWREQGLDRLDPLRFGRVEALVRRASGRDGTTRRVIDARVDVLMAEYARIVELGAVVSGDADASVEATPSAFAALASVLDPKRVARTGPPASVADYFREIWSKLSADRQVQQSLDSVPKNAGPLNSSSLVHRALWQMRDISPEYLRQFLAYADTLAWLEDLQGGPAAMLPVKDAPRAAAKKTVKRGRGK